MPVCQPFGTNVTAVCRLPHAKAITRHNRPKLQNVCKIAPPPLGGLNPVAVPRGGTSEGITQVGVEGRGNKAAEDDNED
jgi:hypothetical protein